MGKMRASPEARTVALKPWMQAYSSDALILRTFRYGEADQIVVFLTEDRGKKRGVAKNATKSRRRFGGGLESLSRGRATYVEHERRDLVRLDRIEPKLSPLEAATGQSVSAGAHVLGHAAYFAELLDEWAPENAANERLFRLGAAVAEAMQNGGPSTRWIDALARYFGVEIELARDQLLHQHRHGNRAAHLSSNSVEPLAIGVGLRDLYADAAPDVRHLEAPTSGACRLRTLGSIVHQGPRRPKGPYSSSPALSQRESNSSWMSLW